MGGDVRIVDESGEDYLYSKKRFVPIDVPATVKASIRRHVARQDGCAPQTAVRRGDASAHTVSAFMSPVSLSL